MSAPVVSMYPRGAAFVQFAMALVRSKGSLPDAAMIAADAWGQGSAPAAILRSAVAAGTTTDADWAAGLATYQVAQHEFLGLVAQQSIVGKLAGLRRVPVNVSVPKQTGAVSVAWVGQRKPIPVSAAAFDAMTLPPFKVAGITVISSELARSSAASAEAIIRADLTRVAAGFVDAAFIGTAAAGTDSPAGLLNGVTPTSATASPGADLKALFAAFTGDLDRAFFVTTPTIGAALCSVAYPGAGARGGEVAGVPLITSHSVAAGVLALVDPGRILFADDGVILDASNQASLQMESAPTAAPDAATVFASMWQRNYIALRITRTVNWAAAPGAVAYISGATSY